MPKQRPSAESWVAVAAHQAGAGMGAMDQYRRSQADDVAASLRTSGGDRHGGPLRSQSAGATLDQSAVNGRRRQRRAGAQIVAKRTQRPERRVQAALPAWRSPHEIQGGRHDPNEALKDESTSDLTV